MKVRGDIERVNLATGERFQRVAGDGENRLERVGMADERFMRHHYGASGYVEPAENETERLVEALKRAIAEKRKEQAENTALRETLQRIARLLDEAGIV